MLHHTTPFLVLVRSWDDFLVRVNMDIFKNLAIDNSRTNCTAQLTTLLLPPTWVHTGARCIMIPLRVQLQSYLYCPVRFYPWSMTRFRCILSSIWKKKSHGLFASLPVHSHGSVVPKMSSDPTPRYKHVPAFHFFLPFFLSNFTTNGVKFICCGQIELYCRGSSPDGEGVAHQGASVHVCAVYLEGGAGSLSAGLSAPDKWFQCEISPLNLPLSGERSPFSLAISIAIYGTAPRLNKPIPRCTWANSGQISQN